MQEIQEMQNNNNSPEDKTETENIENIEEKIRIELLIKNKSCRINTEEQQREEDPENKYEKRVQLKTEMLEETIKISEIIKTIQGYNNYFQPILSVENIQIGKITKDNIECETAYQRRPKKETEIITIKTRKYETTTIEKIKRANTKRETLEHYIETWMGTMEILKKLREKKIVHMDINKSTLLYSNEKGRPIMSGFNLAFQKESIHEMNWENYIPDMEETEIYAPWCIDIYLLCKLAKQTPEERNRIDNKTIANWCEEYVNHPKSFYGKLGSIEKRQEYLTNVQNVYRMTSDHATPLWKQLIENADTWDLHAVCVMYLYIAIETKLIAEMERNKYIKKVIEILKSVVYAMPNSRPQIEYVEQMMKPIEQHEITPPVPLPVPVPVQIPVEPDPRPNPVETIANIEVPRDDAQQIPIENPQETTIQENREDRSESPIEKTWIESQDPPPQPQLEIPVTTNTSKPEENSEEAKNDIPLQNKV